LTRPYRIQCKKKGFTGIITSDVEMGIKQWAWKLEVGTWNCDIGIWTLGNRKRFLPECLKTNSDQHSAFTVDGICIED
jgi:hypothetical protein